MGESCLTVALVPVGLTQFSHLYTGETMNAENASRILATAERWGERSRKERGFTWVSGSDELYLLAGRELPPPSFYGDYPQIENGVGAVTALRERVADGLSRLPRLEGKKIGVVTGVSMTPLMPPLLVELARVTGASFELITAENSLFGPTTTTAGLLVGADIRRVLGARTDLDMALIPAETINENGLFLDDESFAVVREEFPMPVYASYDFIDVLELEGSPLEPETAGAL
jgi:NifB/MoaA-like Fe-S oxidoreductase